MLEFCESRGRGSTPSRWPSTGPFYDARARGLALTAEETLDVHRRLAAWKRQGRALMFSAAAYEKVLGWPDPDPAHHVQRRRLEMHGGQGLRAHRAQRRRPSLRACTAARFEPKNILRDGLEESLRNAQRHDCGDCWSAYLNERKLVFGLRPAALVEVLRRG